MFVDPHCCTIWEPATNQVKEFKSKLSSHNTDKVIYEMIGNLEKCKLENDSGSKLKVRKIEILHLECPAKISS